MNIRAVVDAYRARHPDERERLAPLVQALDNGNELTSRNEFAGHVTCSAIILDAVGQVLLIRHNATGIWMQPGGHVEPDDPTLLDAALREVEEETGIKAESLTALSDAPIDIDPHQIAAVPAKGEPAHWHYDFRYVFTLHSDVEITLQAEEVSGWSWRPISHLYASELRGKVEALVKRTTINVSEQPETLEIVRSV